MSNCPDPCLTCDKNKNNDCHRNHCGKWKAKYLYRQEQINAYAQHNGIVPGAPEYTPGKNPCDDCARSEVCSNICKARAAWWDECIRRAKENWRVANE